MDRLKLEPAGPEKKDPAEDPWKDEPSRHPALMPRNHLPVPPEPEDPAKWQLSIGGEEARSVSLTLEDLKTK
eukprot:1156993-Pelagomonas_calceolata.AAC.12